MQQLEGQRLTWEEIKKAYPKQNVGLVNVEYNKPGKTIKSAVVKCTSHDTSYDEMCLMGARKEIVVRYTSLDEELLL